MKRVFLGISGLCLLGLVSAASAQISDLKIAYVNMAKAIETSTHAETVLTRLKSEFDPKDQKLTGQREKLKKSSLISKRKPWCWLIPTVYSWKRT